MALEQGDFISDLVETNPPGTDNVSQGDDHVRLIKHVLKTTFPNIDGAVTVTEEDMNTLPVEPYTPEDAYYAIALSDVRQVLPQSVMTKLNFGQVNHDTHDQMVDGIFTVQRAGLYIVQSVSNASTFGDGGTFDMTAWKESALGVWSSYNFVGRDASKASSDMTVNGSILAYFDVGDKVELRARVEQANIGVNVNSAFACALFK